MAEQRSAFERHREALLARAIGLQDEREQRIKDRKARELAELRNSPIIKDESPLAEMVREARKDDAKKGWFKWW